MHQLIDLKLLRYAILSILGVVFIGCGWMVERVDAQGTRDGHGIIRDNGKYDKWAEGFDDPDKTFRGTFYNLDAATDPRRPDLIQEDLMPEILLWNIIDQISQNAYARALEYAKTLVAIAPTHPSSYYNLACCYSRMGDIEAGLQAFDQAIEFGWRYAGHARIDSDLATLKTDPRFDALLRKMDRLIAQEKVNPQPLRIDDPAAAIADLKIEIPDLMERYRVPGMSIALVRDGNVVWADGFGIVDTRKPKQVQKNTLFRVFAPSRLLVAVQALAMQERGAWKLDDPITNWLDYVGGSDSPAPDSVTVRSIMNFTAGLRYRYLYEMPGTIAEEIRDTFVVVPERVGSKYSYVPRSYLIIGRAIEDALKPTDETDPNYEHDMARTLAEHLTSNIQRPLGLNMTFFVAPWKKHVIATGHTEYATPFRSSVTVRRPDSPIYTTAGDLGDLLAFLMSSPAENTVVKADKRLISQASIESLYETPLPLESGQAGFGLGVRMQQTPYGRMAEIGNVYEGVGSYMRWYPDHNTGIVVLFNCDQGMEAAQRIAHRALGGI